MKIISVVNTKGGTGKSTIAVNLAGMFVARGYKVTLIDTDKKQQSSLSFLRLRAQHAELPPIGGEAYAGNSLFKEIRKFEDMDYLIIDAGAGDSELLRATIMLGKYGLLVIPVQPAIYDIWATQDTLELVDSSCDIPGFEDVREHAFLLLNRVPGNQRINISGEARDTLSELARQHQLRCCDTELHERVAYKEAVGLGLSAAEYAARSRNAEKARMEMEALSNELLQKLRKEA